MSQNPYEAPQPTPLSQVQIAQQYSTLPWYRKSSYVSPITLLGLCCSPAILAVCIIVLTGDVYYNQTDAAGNLKKWGFANKLFGGTEKGAPFIIRNCFERARG